MTTTFKRLFTQYKILALLVAIALIWAFFSWKTDGGFTSARNLSNLMRQMSITGILACVVLALALDALIVGGSRLLTPWIRATGARS